MPRFLTDLQRAGSRVIPEEGKRKNFLIYISISIAVVLGLLLLTFVLSGEDRDKALETIAKGLLWGGVYALIALGVVVVFKASRVFNLAHGGVLLFLTYFLWWLLAPSKMGLPLPAALIIVALTAVFIGLGINRFLMRPMIGDTGLVTFIMTLVLGFLVIQGITVIVFTGKTQIMPDILPWADESASIGNITLPWELVFAFITATVMFLVFVSYFRYTKGGLAMRCVSEDNTISQSLGINVKRICAIAWAVGCLSAAIGGMLLGSRIGIYSDNMGIGGVAIFRALPVLLLGGLESIPGAYVGALIIGLAERLTSVYIDPSVPGFKDVLPYILMVVILLIRPSGLFGLKRIERI